MTIPNAPANASAWTSPVDRGFSAISPAQRIPPSKSFSPRASTGRLTAAGLPGPDNPLKAASMKDAGRQLRTACLGNSLDTGLYRELQVHAAGMEGVDVKGAREVVEETAVEVLREIGGVGR